MGKKLPKELAENARRLKRNAAAMHRTRAQAALARFRAARDAVSHAWWEMGAAACGGTGSSSPHSLW